MGRGYSREAYLSLVEHARAVVPGVSISSDFISGFCGETEADHEDTLSLMEIVRYDQVSPSTNNRTNMSFLSTFFSRRQTHKPSEPTSK